MATRTIHCETCQHETIARNKLARYCGLCRLVKNLIYLKQTTRECWACEQRFAPLRRDDVICGNCDTPLQSDPIGTCAYCKMDDVPLYRGVAKVCHRCLTEPANRKPILAALVRKQAKQIAEASA